MDALTCLLTRRTVPVQADLEPSREAMRTILEAATHAPDHKLLRPWRFILIRGAARAQLGEALVAAAQATDAATPPEVLEKLRKKTTRAPLLAVVVASPSPTGKAPLWEQHASVAAAAQNMCLAAHALGLGSAWKSTHLGDAPAVKAFLHTKAEETCFGWIEIGHRPPELREKERPPVALETIAVEMDGSGVKPFVP